MKLKIDGLKQECERQVTITVNDVDFRISVNKFNQVVVNKMQYGEGESGIIIIPSVSNEIRIL